MTVSPERQIKDAVCAICSSKLPRLRSIVLTGSMARGESSFMAGTAGWDCLGDAECLLVFESPKFAPHAQTLTRLLQEIRCELANRQIRCPISLSPVTTNYFRRIRPHIFGYELRACGDVIWGDPLVLRLIPEFGSRQIPKEDAWRLLSNRLIELLECAASDFHAHEPEQLGRRLQYRVAKLYLDMATSYLVFLNRFEAGYSRRANILEDVAAGKPEHPFESLSEFVQRVRGATCYKLNGESRFGNEPNWVSTAVEDAKALWRWELKKLAHSSDGMPKQSFYRRLRGWAFVARQCGWHTTLRHWPRWLTIGIRQSPRYLIYEAATTVAFGVQQWTLPQADTKEFARVRRLLPIAKPGRSDDWRNIAAEIGWNYHEFLEITRT